MRCLTVLIVLLLASVASAGPLDAPGYSKSFTCSACHGFAGNSKAETVPVLAGATAAYLKKALQDYASGRRPSTEMEPYAKMAIHMGVDDVAAYFAAQTREPTGARPATDAIARGRAGAVACARCHGPDGRGDAAAGVPDLRGQPQAYLLNQMLLFKADRRSPGDPALDSLKTLMKTIPDGALADIAAYFAGQPPR
jgi:cytochrome c553